MSNGVFDTVEEAMNTAWEESLLFCVRRRKIRKRCSNCVLFKDQSFVDKSSLVVIHYVTLWAGKQTVCMVTARGLFSFSSLPHRTQ